MPDEVIMDGNYGDSIMIDGECYVLDGPDAASPTHDYSDIQSVFDSCDLCFGGLSSSSSSLSSSSSSNSSSSMSSSSDSVSSSSDSVSSSLSSSSSSSSSGGFVPSLDCSGGTVPSMVFVVTGASGTINWCGQTWNLPADSGVAKEICPTAYSLTGAWERWSYRDLPNGLLKLFRYDVGYTNGTASQMIFQAGETTDPRQSQSVFIDPLHTANSTVSIQDPFDIYTGSRPTASDLKIKDEWFTSITTTGGITYSWQRGTNW